TMLVALVSGALLGSAIWMPQAAPRPDLSGRWTYNAGQSDNPRSLMQRPDSAGGRPGMEGAGGRGAVGGGFRGGRGGFGGGRGGGGDVQIKAQWQGNDLVVERKVSGGGKVTEDYLRSQDGKQLYVIVSFDGGRGRTIDFRRVYDAAASAPQTQ